MYLYLTLVYCQLCIEKTKINKKRPGMAHLKKNQFNTHHLVGKGRTHHKAILTIKCNKEKHFPRKSFSFDSISVSDKSTNFPTNKTNSGVPLSMSKIFCQLLSSNFNLQGVQINGRRSLPRFTELRIDPNSQVVWAKKSFDYNFGTFCNTTIPFGRHMITQLPD